MRNVVWEKMWISGATVTARAVVVAEGYLRGRGAIFRLREWVDAEGKRQRSVVSDGSSVFAAEEVMVASFV